MPGAVAQRAARRRDEDGLARLEARVRRDLETLNHPPPDWVPAMRTARGEELMALMADELALSAPGSAGDRTGAVRTFVKVLERSVGGLPVRRAPKWVRPLIGWAQRRFGPKGLEFARTRVEMKMAEGILTLRQQRPHRMKRMIPSFAWDLVSRYGIAARPGERMEDVS